MEFNFDPRRFSKEHRKEYVETHWLERLGEGILDGIAQHDPKAFELARAILNHLEQKHIIEVKR